MKHQMDMLVQSADQQYGTERGPSNVLEHSTSSDRNVGAITSFANESHAGTGYAARLLSIHTTPKSTRLMYETFMMEAE